MRLVGEPGGEGGKHLGVLDAPLDIQAPGINAVVQQERGPGAKGGRGEGADHARRATRDPNPAQRREIDQQVGGTDERREQAASQSAGNNADDDRQRHEYAGVQARRVAGDLEKTISPTISPAPANLVQGSVRSPAARAGTAFTSGVAGDEAVTQPTMVLVVTESNRTEVL